MDTLGRGTTITEPSIGHKLNLKTGVICSIFKCGKGKQRYSKLEKMFSKEGGKIKKSY